MATLISKPTTTAYIQSIIAPHVPQIRAGSTIEDLVAWMQSLPVPLVNRVAYRPIGCDLEAFRSRLIQILGAVLSQSALEFGGGPLLPWDIIDGIYDRGNEMAEIANFFGIPEIDSIEAPLLPVTVTLDGQRLTFQMSKMMALGLVLFSQIAGFDFAPEMYGVPFSYFDTIEERSDFLELSERQIGYHITISGEKYFLAFEGSMTRFLHGFITGASWAGVDHHDYWSNYFQMAPYHLREDLTF